jgi:hypothetical protein
MSLLSAFRALVSVRTRRRRHGAGFPCLGIERLEGRDLLSSLQYWTMKTTVDMTEFGGVPRTPITVNYTIDLSNAPGITREQNAVASQGIKTTGKFSPSDVSVTIAKQTYLIDANAVNVKVVDNAGTFFADQPHTDFYYFEVSNFGGSFNGHKIQKLEFEFEDANGGTMFNSGVKHPVSSSFWKVVDPDFFGSYISTSNYTKVAFSDSPGSLAFPSPSIKFVGSTVPDAYDRLWIDSTPKMPSVSLELTDIPLGFTASTAVKWTVARSLLASDAPHGRTYSAPTFTQNGAGPRVALAFPQVAGGDLDVTASFTVEGKEFKVSTEDETKTRKVKVWSHTPSVSELRNALMAVPVPAKWPANTTYDYRQLLLQIAKKESFGGQQFYPSGTNTGKPVFNSTNDGGVGLYQITPGKVSFPVTFEHVWNWKVNLAAGVRVFNEKIAEAVAWDARHRVDSTVNSKIQQQKLALGVPSNSVIQTISLTANQVVEEAIQRYNGGNAWRIVGGRLDGLNGGAFSTISIRKRPGTSIWEATWRKTDNGYVAAVLAQR